MTRHSALKYYCYFHRWVHRSRSYASAWPEGSTVEKTISENRQLWALYLSPSKKRIYSKARTRAIFKGHWLMWSIMMWKVCGQFCCSVQITPVRPCPTVQACHHWKMFGLNAVTSGLLPFSWAVQHQVKHSWHCSLWKDSRSPQHRMRSWAEVARTHAHTDGWVGPGSQSCSKQNLCLWLWPPPLLIVHVENEAGQK